MAPPWFVKSVLELCRYMSGKPIVHSSLARLLSGMALLLQAKRAGSVPAAIFFVLFFTLFSLLGGALLSVGIGNPVNKVTHSLLSSQSFKTDAGTYFVSKALESAKGDERALLLKKGPQISQTVTSILSNPIFKSEIDQISNIAYTYYTSGDQTQQTIDVKPLLQLALLGLESVDPQFSQLNRELVKIKPITLKPQIKGPSASKVKSYFKWGVLVLLLLTLLTLGLYLLFAKSGKNALRTIGIVLLSDGVFLILVNKVSEVILKNQATKATQSLAREAIPIGAHPLLAPLGTVGIIELLLGGVLLALSFVRTGSKPAVTANP